MLVCGDVALTFSGQNSDADARVTEFDEGQTARPFVLLSDQQNIFGTDVAVYEILLLLCANMTKYHRDMSLFVFFHVSVPRVYGRSGCYQVEHGPGQLFGHFQLPRDVDAAFVLLQINVQRTKSAKVLHHHV